MPATFEGTPAEQLIPAEAAYYLGDNRDVARALGIPVDRTPVLERGTFYLLRPPGAGPRIIVGTRIVDPYEAVRRDARRIVRAGMYGVTPYDLRDAHRRQLEAEELIDQLVGAPPAWPA